jgi:hypothetical protein
MREYFVKKHVVRVSSLLLVVLMVFSFSSCSKVEVAEGEIIAVFQYGDAEISKPLSDEDSEIVRKIFAGKRLFSDSPSCGFDENVALIIDGNTYCIACDTCGVIYNVEKDKYFNLNDKENETLRNLLCEYGFTFPCV